MPKRARFNSLGKNGMKSIRVQAIDCHKWHSDFERTQIYQGFAFFYYLNKQFFGFLFNLRLYRNGILAIILVTEIVLRGTFQINIFEKTYWHPDLYHGIVK